MRRNFSTVLIVLILAAGLALLLYPSFSNFNNRRHQSEANEKYEEMLNTLDYEEFRALWDKAERYNELLYESAMGRPVMSDETFVYEELLSIAPRTQMSFIDIEKIDAHIAIWHGTDEGTLQNYIGHWEASSLPVGGESTHCVLTGHTGLPSARLFTDLDKLVIGDVFTLILFLERKSIKKNFIFARKGCNSKALRPVTKRSF